MEEPDWAELEIRERARAWARAERLTAVVDGEAVDPAWGPTMEQQIAERFAAEAPTGFELVSATCKTSMCVAEVATPSQDASTGEMGWHRFLGFSRAYIHHRGDEGDAFRSVVFIARAGHSLPM